MNKYVPYLIIAVLLVGAGAFVSNRVGITSTQNAQMTEGTPGQLDLGSSPTPVSELRLDNQKAVETSIDGEVKWLDGEEKAVNQVDFSDSGLSNEELGV